MNKPLHETKAEIACKLGDVFLNNAKKRIKELEAQVEKNELRISELKDRIDYLFLQNWKGNRITTIDAITKGLAKRDLEQQAKGIDWVLACRETNLSNGDVHTFMDKCNQLRRQATEAGK